MPVEVTPDVTTEQLERDLESARRRLYKLVRAADPKALAKRPPSGDAEGTWSALEHVRHLLFADQLHYSVVLKGKVDWSPLGVTGMRAKKFARVGTAKPNLEEVLSAWDQIRDANRKALQGRDDEDVRKTFYGNTRHIRIHTAAIERLLHQPTG
jgi:hypothetical protein